MEASVLPGDAEAEGPESEIDEGAASDEADSVRDEKASGVADPIVTVRLKELDLALKKTGARNPATPIERVGDKGGSGYKATETRSGIANAA